MTTRPVGNIRLSSGDGRNDLLYNGYHLLTQLSAMYTHFTAHAQSAEHKQVYENLSLDILTDIGDLYIAWEAFDKDSKPVTDAKKLAKRLVLTCNHLFKVITLTDAWTPFIRTATLANYLERRWLRILAALIDGAGKETAVLTELSARADVRAKLVTTHLEKTRLKDRYTQKSFDAADRILLDKSFGF